MSNKTAIVGLILALSAGTALAMPAAEAGERGYERGERYGHVEKRRDKRGFRDDRHDYRKGGYGHHRHDHWKRGYSHHRHDYKWHKPRGHYHHRDYRYSYRKPAPYYRHHRDGRSSTSVTIRWGFYD